MKGRNERKNDRLMPGGSMYKEIVMFLHHKNFGFCSNANHNQPAYVNDELGSDEFKMRYNVARYIQAIKKIFFFSLWTKRRCFAIKKKEQSITLRLLYKILTIINLLHHSESKHKND
ncbi:CLUMA_CG019208, isoform A [Clunio marinus]|uniref:CLUMA_CG019208, isoform A n=1 Tax=Clunio marinus TaxID=568069 RepID=A0A1J1J2C2_9DIPT|nr:CLUMA_CG019208, isoform A [Clunio marinus]